MNTTHIPMSIHSYPRQTPQRSHKGYNRPEISAGTHCYAIAYEPDLGYFPYSYTTYKRAQETMKNIIKQGTDTEYYRQWNVKQSADETIVCEG